MNQLKPKVGTTCPVFGTDQEAKKFFDDFRKSVKEDLKEFAKARRESEQIVYNMKFEKEFDKLRNGG